MRSCGHKQKRDANSDWCHSCYMIEWRAKNPDKTKAYAKKHYEKKKKEDPEGLRKQQRAEKLRNVYGITETDVDRMKQEQGGVCALCERDRYLVIDHCHETGKVRGLLCRPCNASLGSLGDNAAGLQKALEYVT